MKIINNLLLVVLLMGLCVGCSKSSSIVGTWDGKGEATVLGKGTEVATMEIINRYTFEENGTGTYTVLYQSDTESEGKPFEYEMNDGMLTIKYSENKHEEYRVDINNNSLTLDGPWYLELTRVR